LYFSFIIYEFLKKELFVINVSVIKVGSPVTMEPLTCCRKLHKINVAGKTIIKHLENMFNAGDTEKKEADIEIRADFWPSKAIVQKALSAKKNFIIVDKNGQKVLKVKCTGSDDFEKFEQDEDSLNLIYPWDILVLNERLIAALKEDKIKGKVSEGVHVDGVLQVGKGTVLLPGVYIEGNVIIGENCKIGPNCYIRGNTYIGDECHVGQAVEIKNSLLMKKVSVGHLSYVGDSIVCPHTNFGAGTISANLRHDGRNHRSLVNNELIDTGRRKMGVIVGDHVHTGIHCSIYPGRKIWPHVSTEPGSIIRKDEKVLFDI
jgi:bifunctional UDP-N-acetylglucosamine pyrophosphorylase/glucosamine-1-phosphate N-acetyltransferase